MYSTEGTRLPCNFPSIECLNMGCRDFESVREHDHQWAPLLQSPKNLLSSPNIQGLFISAKCIVKFYKNKNQILQARGISLMFTHEQLANNNCTLSCNDVWVSQHATINRNMITIRIRAPMMCWDSTGIQERKRLMLLRFWNWKLLCWFCWKLMIWNNASRFPPWKWMLLLKDQEILVLSIWKWGSGVSFQIT